MANPAPTNPYRSTGLVLLIGGFLFGLVAYALVASLVGERRLEGADGLTPLGLVVMLMPAASGLVLLVFGRRIAGVVPSTGWWAPGLLSAVGLSCLVVGLAGVAAGNAAGDANIGAGLLVLAGPILLIAGVVNLLRRRRRDSYRPPPPPPSAPPVSPPPRAA